MGVTCLGRRRHVGTVSTPVLWGGAATCACPGLNTTPTGHCTTSPATPGRPTAINCKKEAYISIIRNSSIFLKYTYVSIEVNYCIHVTNSIRTQGDHKLTEYL